MIVINNKQIQIIIKSNILFVKNRIFSENFTFVTKQLSFGYSTNGRRNFPRKWRLAKFEFGARLVVATSARIKEIPTSILNEAKGIGERELWNTIEFFEFCLLVHPSYSERFASSSS